MSGANLQLLTDVMKRVRVLLRTTVRLCIFSVSRVNVQFLPVARVTDFDWERDQTIGIQLMLRPPERLPQKLLFPPPFAAT